MRALALAAALAALPAAAQSDHVHAEGDGHDHAEAAREGNGRLAFAAEAHSFGSVREGDVVSHTFAFTNAGAEPVTLAEVRASCGCTTPRYTEAPIAPGALGEIVVEYNSAGRPGPFDRTVTVVADGATPRVTTLRITGTVVADFATSGVRQGNVVFEADLWDAAEVAAPGPLQHAFAFQNAGTAPLRVRAVRTVPEAGVEVSFPDRPLFSGDVATLMVTVADVAALARPNGRFEVALQVETTDPEQPVKSLLLRGRAVAAPPVGAAATGG